ncbi:MAG: hypothetical protein R2744_05290 [Bacteroidales bacterium]
MVMDLESGRVREISKKSRYFSPSLSGDGSRIAVSESTPENSNGIVILNTKDGSVVARFEIGDNIMPLVPVWMEDNQSLLFISHSEKGEGIMSLNTIDGSTTRLVPQGRDDLESLAVTGDTILFTSSRSGIDNVYAIVPGGEIRMVTSSRFGVADISASGNELLFSDYSADGNSIGRIEVTGTGITTITSCRKGRNPTLSG